MMIRRPVLEIVELKHLQGLVASDNVQRTKTIKIKILLMTGTKLIDKMFHGVCYFFYSVFLILLILYITFFFVLFLY